jgi:membrane protein DedA with SNARE-associated domain
MVLAQCAGLPLPAVAVLLAAEASAERGVLTLSLVIAVGSAGAILGSTIGYVLGRIGGRPLMLRLVRLVHAKESRVDAMERFFERHGGKTVFIGRWVIFVRLWGSIAAGAARMPWPRFMLWNVVGSILWVASLGLLAYLLGGIARRIAEALDLGGWMLLPVVAVGFVVWGLRRRGQPGGGPEDVREQPAEAARDGSD